MAEGTSLGAVVHALAEKDPDRPAITHEGSTVSRLELDQRTNRLARTYQNLGVTPNSFVTIGLPNGIEFIEATLATWKCGATPQPISHRLPSAERKAIIELANPSLVVGIDRTEAGDRPSVPAGYDPDPGTSDEPLPPVVSEAWKAPASGGSTGRPKLIVATQPSVIEAIEPFANLLRIPHDGVHLVTGPLYHNGPFVTSILALLRGNHVVVMTRFDASLALELIERYRVDWVYAVPTMMLRIWRLPEDERLRRDVSSLEMVFHMASPCPSWLKEAWIEWLGADRVLELYGGTEAQSLTVITGEEWLSHRGSVGKPILGEMKILGSDGGELPRGEVGEIWMRRGEEAPSPYRYLGAEAKKRDGGWECLGDMGWMDDEGYLYITDRDSDMILVGGANVYPAEVEAALEEHPAVRSSCVIGLPNEEYGNTVHAIVETYEPISETVLVPFLSERIAKYKMPRSFEFVGEPLRGDDGKVRRPALRAQRVKG